MTETHMLFFSRAGDEAPGAFGARVRGVATDLAADPRATAVVAFADDGAVGAPAEASAFPSTYAGVVLVSGVPGADLPAADAACRMQRRVVKGRTRGRDGARSPGFTIVCPSVRRPDITHDQFDAHWRDVHSKVHVDSSPGTCHYEQLVIDEWLTPDAPAWDGVGLLSVASERDYTERFFGPGGMEAIYADIPNFLDLERGETLPASEFVYCDDAA